MAEISLKAIIIGMMTVVLFISLSFAIMLDMYSEDNLNIDLADDNATAPLEDLQTKIEEQQAQIKSDNKYIEDRVIGGNETELGKDVSESNLISSSLTALTNTPSYISSFFTILYTSTGSIGGAMGGALAGTLWYFVGALIIIVAFLLLGSVLQRSP